MAEEVVIKVRQESQGNALTENARKIEELKGKIAELNQLEKTYTEKGIPSAAASTRTERIPYARELRELQGERRALQKANDQDSAGVARERTGKEREITNEARAQRREHEAIEKARDRAARRIRTAAVGLAESELGMGRFSGITNAMMSAGGGLKTAAIGAGIALAVAAAVTKGFQFYFSQKDQDTALGNRIGEERASGNRSLGRMARYGTAGQAFGQTLELRERVAALGVQGQTLRDEAHEGITGRLDKALGTEFFTKGFSFIKPKSARAIEANDKERQLAQEQLDKTEAVNKELFKVEGGQEIAQQRARVEGRYKEAFAIDMASQAFKRYRDLTAQGASPEEAREGASLILRQRAIDVHRGLAGLAGARDGRANLAALASLGSSFSTSDAGPHLEKLIAVVERGQAQYGAQSALQTHRR